MPLMIVRNDITKMEVDAIVNAANTALCGGSGVDGAIHRAAGPELLAECRQLGGCARGHAKITKAYRLPGKYVIHTVGPVWQGGGHGECDVLASCYRSSLELALEYHCETIAFPLISSGVYGYPKTQALRIATKAICDFLQEQEMTVYLVLFDREAFRIGQELFDSIAAYIDQQYVEDHTDSADERSRWRAYRDLEMPVLQSPGQPEPLRQVMAAEPPDKAKRKKAPPKAKKRFFQKAFEKAASEAPCAMAAAPLMPAAVQGDWSLADALRQMDEGFSETLLRLIDQRGMTDAQCYKKANIDRKLFSKIRGNPAYRPSKATALAFAVALELSLNETEEFLRKAGFALSRSSKFDIIVEYFISRECYDVIMINEALFAFDQSLLGG